MADWRNILSDKDEKLTDEDLLRYMSENLSEEEKNIFERKATESFESDAIDGLQQIKDKARLRKHVHQLNQKLPQLLRYKKNRIQKNKLKDFQWIILAILILLFLCIMSYVILTMHDKSIL